MCVIKFYADGIATGGLFGLYGVLLCNTHLHTIYVQVSREVVMILFIFMLCSKVLICISL